MTISAWLSLLASAFGVVFVVIGLYRRDPWMQGKVAATRALFSGRRRRLLRRASEHRKVEVPGGGSGREGAEAHVSLRPGPPPDRDAPVEERLEWVERAVDSAFRELDSETLGHDENVRDLVEKVVDLRAALESGVSTPHPRPDEARVPERLEWWGVTFILVGLAFAFIDAVVRSS